MRASAWCKTEAVVIKAQNDRHAAVERILHLHLAGHLSSPRASNRQTEAGSARAAPARLLVAGEAFGRRLPNAGGIPGPWGSWQDAAVARRARERRENRTR